MPPALYPTFREVFLERVIRIEAVQRERDAAIEESRQPGAIVTRDDIEMFFDHGIIPGVSARPPRKMLFDDGIIPGVSAKSRSSLWPISTAEPSKLPPKLTALDQGFLAALRAWHQLVRELRNGTPIATGARFEWPHPAAVDGQEIDRGTWLDDTLWFDVRDKRICSVTGDSYDRKTIPRWFDVQMRGADEAAEFEDDQPAKENAPAAGKREGRPPEIRDRLAANADYNWPEIARVDAEEYWKYVATHGKAPTWDVRASLISERVRAPYGDYLRTSKLVAKTPAKPKP